MNKEQFQLIKRLIELEKNDAAVFEYEDEATRQWKKESWHRYGLEEFKRLGMPKNPNPPTKLTDKVCSILNCFFCHPDLLPDIEAELRKN